MDLSPVLHPRIRRSDDGVPDALERRLLAPVEDVHVIGAYRTFSSAIAGIHPVADLEEVIVLPDVGHAVGAHRDRVGPWRAEGKLSHLARQVREERLRQLRVLVPRPREGFLEPGDRLRSGRRGLYPRSSEG